MTKAKQPLISIVTPVYNAELFLTDTVATVQAQTYQNWELILVDDCSTDESPSIIQKIAKKDKRIRLVSMSKNGGAAIARNKGIDEAKGRYLAFLDADDIWESTKLQKQLSFMQENNHPFTFTSYEFADENGKANGKVVNVPKSITYNQSLKNHIIWTSTVMIDLEKVAKDVAHMPNVRRGQDTATWWKILRTVGKGYGLQEVLSYYRRTNASLSSNKFKAMKRTWYLFSKVEKLGLPKSIYNFCWYGYNAVRKRI